MPAAGAFNHVRAVPGGNSCVYTPSARKGCVRLTREHSNQCLCNVEKQLKAATLIDQKLLSATLLLAMEHALQGTAARTLLLNKRLAQPLNRDTSDLADLAWASILPESGFRVSGIPDHQQVLHSVLVISFQT